MHFLDIEQILLQLNSLAQLLVLFSFLNGLRVLSFITVKGFNTMIYAFVMNHMHFHELPKRADDRLEVYGTSEQFKSVDCVFMPEELQT